MCPSRTGSKKLVHSQSVEVTLHKIHAEDPDFFIRAFFNGDNRFQHSIYYQNHCSPVEKCENGCISGNPNTHGPQNVPFSLKYLMKNHNRHRHVWSKKSRQRQIYLLRIFYCSRPEMNQFDPRKLPGSAFLSIFSAKPGAQPSSPSPDFSFLKFLKF